MGNQQGPFVLTHLAMFCSITMFYALFVVQTMVLVANILPINADNILVLCSTLIQLKAIRILTW